jgi:hypothetical protein
MRFRPLFLTLALLLLVPANAFADGGNVMGTVYLDGFEAGGLCVDVFADYTDAVVASQQTNSGGEYNIYVADPGNYMVRFSDCGQGYTTMQWYWQAPRHEDATIVQVVSDADTPQVNGYLSSAGRVTGNVKNTLDAVLTGACVRAEDQSGATLAEATADGNGDYALGGLPPGQVSIHFSGCTSGNYVPEYYDDAATADAAAPVVVEAGATANGIDAVLAPAGRISGHVQNADGDPLQGMCVKGFAGDLEADATTDSNGDYVIREVPPAGTYELSAYDCYEGDGTYLDDHRSGQLGGVVNQVVNFTLPRPGHIVGHVRDDAGAGLAAICVTAIGTDIADRLLARTDRNGYYELNGLRPGTYDLSFNTGGDEDSEEVCAPNAGWAPAATKAVVLGDGETLWDVDKALAHPVADPGGGDPGTGGSGGGDPGAGGGGSGGGGSGGASGGGDPGTGSGSGAGSGSGGGAHPAAARCKVPRLVGLSLPKARRALARAGCHLGHVTRRHGRRHGRVLRQKIRHGASKPLGFKVALTVAK